MSYQLYRNTTLGHTLQESLDEMIQYGQMNPQLACRVLLQFDKSINQTLATRVKSRLTFKAGKLNTYRFCDNVWTFMLNDVEFREVQEVTKIDKVKIVACDGKNIHSKRRISDYKMLLTIISPGEESKGEEDLEIKLIFNQVHQELTDTVRTCYYVLMKKERLKSERLCLF